MKIAPAPYKLKCPECGYSKIVKLKRDVLKGEDILAMSTTCPKCEGKMERVEMNFLDKVFSKLG